MGESVHVCSKHHSGPISIAQGGNHAVPTYHPMHVEVSEIFEVVAGGYIGCSFLLARKLGIPMAVLVNLLERSEIWAVFTDETLKRGVARKR